VKETRPERSISWFGIVQIAIGVTALLVTLFIRDILSIPFVCKTFSLVEGSGLLDEDMVKFPPRFHLYGCPAFFMGVAFPLAGKVYAEYKKKVGSAVERF